MTTSNTQRQPRRGAGGPRDAGSSVAGKCQLCRAVPGGCRLQATPSAPALNQHAAALHTPRNPVLQPCTPLETLCCSPAHPSKPCAAALHTPRKPVLHGLICGHARPHLPARQRHCKHTRLTQPQRRDQDALTQPDASPSTASSKQGPRCPQRKTAGALPLLCAPGFWVGFILPLPYPKP